jgi:hypothetical protein
MTKLGYGSQRTSTCGFRRFTLNGLSHRARSGGGLLLVFVRRVNHRLGALRMWNTDVGSTSSATDDQPQRSRRDGQNPLATEIGAHDPEDVTCIVSHLATSRQRENGRDELSRTGSGCWNLIGRGGVVLEISMTKLMISDDFFKFRAQ